jgi:hypothetical protein
VHSSRNLQDGFRGINPEYDEWKLSINEEMEVKKNVNICELDFCGLR